MDRWSVCSTAKRSHLFRHCRNPCCTAFSCAFTGLSSALYSTCQAKELNVPILLYLAKNKREKNNNKTTKNKARGVLLQLHSSFFLHCTAITGSGLQIYKSFIWKLMHCTWWMSAYFGCSYTGMRYWKRLSMWKQIVLCVIVLNYKYCWNLSA